MFTRNTVKFWYPLTGRVISKVLLSLVHVVLGGSIKQYFEIGAAC